MAEFKSRAREVVAAHQHKALDNAMDDSVTIARQNAVKRTGKWAGSIQRTQIVVRGQVMSSSVGSRLVSALAHEKGAYIQAKRYPTLVIRLPDGSFRRPKAVRLQARPVIRPAVIATMRLRFAAGWRIR